MKRLLLIALLVIAPSVLLMAQTSEIKSESKKAAREVKRVSKKVAKETKKAGKETGRAFKKETPKVKRKMKRTGRAIKKELRD